MINRSDKLSTVDSWFHNYYRDYILLIEGPHGIGKTQFVRSYCKQQSPLGVFYIDVKEDKEQLTSILSDRYLNVDNFYSSLFFMKNTKMPTGGEVLIFENIEYCPLLRQFGKTLAQKSKYRIIFTTCGGRGIEHYGDDKLIPSNEMVVHLNPLNFVDFLKACDKKDLANHLTHCLETKTAISGYISSELRKIYDTYLIVGGYPSVVEHYKKTKDVIECAQMNHQILEQQFDHLKDFIGREIKTFERIKDNLDQIIINQSLSSLSAKEKYYAGRVLALMEEEGILNIAKAVDYSSDGKEQGKNKYYFGFPFMYAAISAFQDDSSALDAMAVKEKIILSDFYQGQRLKGFKTEYGLSRSNSSYFASDALMDDGERKTIVSIKMKRLDKKGIKGLSNLTNEKLSKGLVLYDGDVFEYEDIVVLPFYCAGIVDNSLFHEILPF